MLKKDAKKSRIESIAFEIVLATIVNRKESLMCSYKNDDGIFI